MRITAARIDIENWEEDNGFSDCPRSIKRMLNCNYNSIVYDINDDEFAYVEATKEIKPWMALDIERYIFDRDAFDWALQHMNDDHFAPNARCPICQKYMTIEQYTGNRVLSLACRYCATAEMEDQFGRAVNGNEFISYGLNYITIDITYSTCDKIDWVHEGF